MPRLSRSSKERFGAELPEDGIADDMDLNKLVADIESAPSIDFGVENKAILDFSE